MENPEQHLRAQKQATAKGLRQRLEAKGTVKKLDTKIGVADSIPRKTYRPNPPFPNVFALISPGEFAKTGS